MTSSQPVVARLLLPDDANPHGNVHGGTILQLMEQAGMIEATRHCNSEKDSEYYGKQLAGLARFETMRFLEPVFVGEVASLTVDIVFSSARSVLVKVVVTAENAVKGSRRVTNTGLLWYLSFVGSSCKNHSKPLVVPVPQVIAITESGPELDEYNKYKSLYEARKKDSDDESTSCLKINGCLCPSCRETYEPSPNDKKPSHQSLCQVVLPGDCGTSGIAFGGFLMKLMDTAGGCCAVKHCRTNAVTVSISAMDFIGFVHRGDIVSIDAVATFRSQRSMEVEVTASVLGIADNSDTVVARALFSFVSLDENGKVALIPGLRLESDEEFTRAFAGQKRYEEAKRKRLGKKA